MLRRRHTDEFSIILIADKISSDDIATVRDRLPPSPYRDDPPHLTLAYGVRGPKNLSDHDLWWKLQPWLDEMLKAGAHARVAKISNRRGSLYGNTSLIELRLTKRFKKHRHNLLAAMRRHDFRVSRLLNVFYLPHISIRLGVPLTGAVKQDAGRLFPAGRPISFDGYEIYRLISDEGPRRFYKINARVDSK